MQSKTLKRKIFLKYAFCIVFGATFLMQFSAILDRSVDDTQKFSKAKGNYALLRNSYTTLATTTEAKKIIPPLSTVRIPRSPSSIENVAARYNLYPIKVGKNGAYLIDLERSLTDQTSFPQKKKLSNGVFVYAKKGAPFLTKQQMTVGPSLPKKLLIFFAMILFETILGMLALRLLNIPRQATESIWMTTTAYLTGFCIFTISLWILLLLGFTLEISTLIILGLFLLCSLLFLSLDNRTPSDIQPSLSEEKNLPLTRALLVFTTFLIGIIIIWIISSPVKDWDTMANWAIKSKVIFHEQSLNLQYARDNHNYYPILWPLHIAAQFTLLKGAYDEVAVWSSAFFFLILLAQLLKGFRSMGAKSLFAYIGILGYIAYFTSQNPTISALPENIFLCFLTGLLVSICLWLKSPEKKHYLALSIILAAGLNLIKLEGSVATMLVIVSLLLIKRRNIFPRSTRSYLLALSLTIALPLLWIYWVKINGFSNGTPHLQTGLSFQKLFLLMKQNIIQFVDYEEYLVLFFGFAYFIFFPNPRKWSTSEKFLLYVSIFLMIFKWMATLGWSEELILAPGIFHDTGWRLFLHMGPSLVLLFCSRAFNQNPA